MPLIHFDTTPIVGDRLIYKLMNEKLAKLQTVQIFEVVNVKPHTRADGAAAHILKWKSRCSECAGLFRFTTGLTTRGFLRRCGDCRKANKRKASWPTGPRIKQEFVPITPKPVDPSEPDEIDAASLF